MARRRRSPYTSPASWLLPRRQSQRAGPDRARSVRRAGSAVAERASVCRPWLRFQRVHGSIAAAILAALFAQVLYGYHPLVLRGGEHNHTLRRPASDADAVHGAADELAAVRD